MKQADNRQRYRATGTSSPRFARAGRKLRPSKNKDGDQKSPPKNLGKVVSKVLGHGLKFTFIAIAILLAVALLLLLLVGAYLFVSKSDYFSIKSPKVTISGLGQTTRNEIIAAAGLDKSVNIWAFDPDKIEVDISSLPWVDEVTVSKKMPDSAAIEVVEHKPKLLVSLGRLYYLSAKGEPFKELEAGENPRLPILSGFGEDDLLNPGPAVSRALNEVFWLVDTLKPRSDEFSLDNISEINYDMVRGLTLYTKNNRVEVKIGFGTYEEKFRRLGRVVAHLKLRGKYDGLVYLNLEASPRVTVRYNTGA